MAQKSYSATAPGSLMLLGEHAVLAGKSALVCAVNKRMRITLTPNASQIVTINDTKLGSMQLDLANLQIQAPFQFVISAILIFKPRLQTGFNLDIDADFSSVMGLGSSAAVTAVTIAVLAQWLDAAPLPAEKIFLLAREAILAVQKLGSGADLAASVYGGVINYSSEQPEIIPLSIIPDLTAVYCGYKTPTVEVIALVNSAKQRQPQIYAAIFQAMQICVQEACVAIASSDWVALGEIFMQHNGLQNALGTSNLLLDTLSRQLSAQPGIYGAKISGSGLGDCVIGLGTLSSTVFPLDTVQQQHGVLQIPITIDPRGLTYADE